MASDLTPEVTQADRDAAAPILEHLYSYKDGTGADTLFRQDIEAGKHDDHYLIQAFARHRLTATPPAHESRVPTDQIRDAARGLLDRMSWTYKARNGRTMSIEADDGEKCYIVHSDDIEELRRALATFDQAVPSGVDGLVERVAKFVGTELRRVRQNRSLFGKLTETQLEAILAALSPVPASASDAELIARLRAVKDWWRAPGLYAEQAADRIEALTQAVPASAYQVMRDARTALQAMLDAWLDYHDTHSLTDPVTGRAANAFDKALEARDQLDEALTKSPPQETSDGEPPCQ